MSSEFEVIKDEKEIILQEICDKVEYFEWNKLSETLGNTIVNIF